MSTNPGHIDNTYERDDIKKHSPLPWYVGAQNDCVYIIRGKPPALNNDYPLEDADREVIARLFGENEKENAELIIHHINTHGQLLEALKMAYEMCKDYYNAAYADADWHNNNMPNVGQSVDYKPYPVWPAWFDLAEKAIKEAKK